MQLAMALSNTENIGNELQPTQAFPKLIGLHAIVYNIAGCDQFGEVCLVGTLLLRQYVGLFTVDTIICYIFSIFKFAKRLK